MKRDIRLAAGHTRLQAPRSLARQGKPAVADRAEVGTEGGHSPCSKFTTAPGPLRRQELLAFETSELKLSING